MSVISLKDVEEFYDNCTTVGSPRVLIMVALSAQHLKSADSVLDLGCGPGETSVVMSELVKSVTAVDISGRAIEWAHENHPRDNVSYVHSDILTFLKTAEKYSVVTMYDVVEHLLPEQRPAILRKVSQIADRVIINIPTAECLRNLDPEKRQIIDEPVEVSEITKTLGFEQVCEQTYTLNENEHYVLLVYRRKDE